MARQHPSAGWRLLAVMGCSAGEGAVEEAYAPGTELSRGGGVDARSDLRGEGAEAEFEQGGEELGFAFGPALCSSFGAEAFGGGDGGDKVQRCSRGTACGRGHCPVQVETR